MFTNIGDKIKGLAKLFTVIGCICSIIIAIVCWVIAMVFEGFLVLILGCLGSWAGSFLLYGFGELIIQTTEIARLQNSSVYYDSKKPSNTNNGNTAQSNKSIVNNKAIERNWICKKCGTINQSSRLFCKDCGEYK